MVEKIDRIWHSKKWMSAFRLLMVSLMMSALSVTKLASRGSVEERVLNVVECAVPKRLTLRQLSGSHNDPRRIAHSILGKTSVNRWRKSNLRA